MQVGQSAALCPVSYGSYVITRRPANNMHNNKRLVNKILSLSCWCVIFTMNLAEQWYVCEWGRDGVMFMCVNVYDVTLCGNTVRSVALGLWLVGHPCYSVSTPTQMDGKTLLFAAQTYLEGFPRFKSSHWKLNRTLLRNVISLMFFYSVS